MQHNHIWYPHDADHRRDVPGEVEIELVVERGVDRVRRSDQEERMAVRRRTYDRLGCDIAAGAGTVLDDERLAEPLRQPLTYETGADVGRAARGNVLLDLAADPDHGALVPRHVYAFGRDVEIG